MIAKIIIKTITQNISDRPSVVGWTSGPGTGDAWLGAVVGIGVGSIIGVGAIGIETGSMVVAGADEGLVNSFGSILFV
ncbi:MAG: hypothetical protein NTY66_01620 [Candidatus Vogelbacteria bacterium]|nr:hypothetical protein [Candidatus Vogelbacteria bacterium]